MKKYPLEVYSAVHTKQTLGVDCHLTPPDNTDEASPLRLHNGYSRFTLTIVDKQSSTKFAKVNIRADEVPLLCSKYNEALMARTVAGLTKSSSGNEKLSPAYTVQIKTGTFKGKTPAELLLADESQRAALERTQQWLQDNVAKFPANQDIIDAIDDAFYLQDSGSLKELEVTSNQTNFVLFKELFKVMSGGSGKKIKAGIEITCDFTRNNPWVIVISNDLYTEVEYSRLKAGNDVKPESSLRLNISLNDKEMAGFIHAISSIKSMFETMWFPTLWDEAQQSIQKE